LNSLGEIPATTNTDNNQDKGGIRQLFSSMDKIQCKLLMTETTAPFFGSTTPPDILENRIHSFAHLIRTTL
ncbi:MAG: hypothetical protein ACK53Y_24180, partial [bacterium]